MTDLPLVLEHSYAAAVPQLSTPWRAAPAPAPELVILNEELATGLGLDPDFLRSPAGVDLLVGAVPQSHPTYAQAYAGHQFGGYSPRLGDGRALLLGELLDTGGRRRDLHLKGSGRTPFARGGDGRAALGPMLREYLMGEAMHALGIPTTRALAVVATGEQVVRDTVLPGAVLARVASSHLRVGTFQYAAALGDEAVLRALADHAIARHHPEAAEASDPYLALFAAVADAQARLIAQWMGVGFIHGVMNTDNTTISGETIDYGPCAFLERYDPRTVFSSIDHGGRYAYGNQPGIGQWNLARLGETLLPLCAGEQDEAVERAVAVLDAYADRYTAAFDEILAAKLGLAAPDPALQRDLLGLLEAGRVDFTQFFRALADGRAAGLFADPTGFAAWRERWWAGLPEDRDAALAGMGRVNPLYLPRNRPVEDALDAATAGDLAPFLRILDAVRTPYTERPGCADLLAPAPEDVRHVTYCGT